MKTTPIVICGLALAFGLAADASAQKGGRPVADIPVSMFISFAGNERELRIQDDGMGPYVNNTKVLNIIQTFPAGNDWNFSSYIIGKTFKYSDRTVRFDLTEPVTQNFPAPFAQEFVHTHLIAKCSRDNISMVNMAEGASVLCSGSYRFQALDGQWYRFSLQPENYLTEKMKVTCTAANSSGCTDWRITPSGTALTGTDPNPKALLTLLKINSNGDVLRVEGQYYMSFQIDVAR